MTDHIPDTGKKVLGRQRELMQESARHLDRCAEALWVAFKDQHPSADGFLTDKAKEYKACAFIATDLIKRLEAGSDQVQAPVHLSRRARGVFRCPPAEALKELTIAGTLVLPEIDESEGK